MIKLEYKNAKMEVNEIGAEMKAFVTADGTDCLWRGREGSWTSSAPVLFPTIGATKNGGATIDGVFYPVPRHGFCRTRLFTVTEQTESSVTLETHESEDTLKQYPFAFTLKVTYSFDEKGFTARFLVRNDSEKPMPFAIGGHPGFNCPLKDGESFEDYELIFEKPEAQDCLLCTPDTHIVGGKYTTAIRDGVHLPMEYRVFDEIDTYMFAGLNSRSVKLVHKDTQKGIRFDYDMKCLAVWTRPDAHAPYVCLEPWQGLPAFVDETGCFEDKPYITTLEKGKTYECSYHMELC